jgi:hypothetical protein
MISRFLWYGRIMKRKYCKVVMALRERDGIVVIVASKLYLRSSEFDLIRFSIKVLGTENKSNVTRIVSLSIKAQFNS